jgi:RimJ/RimL family protein N-acetyltransferase
MFVDIADGHPEVSYWVLPCARRAGVATRAVVVVTRWAHGVRLHRIELPHSSLNGASGRVALAAGFTSERTRRQSTLHADGWHDMHRYSHLATATSACRDYES